VGPRDQDFDVTVVDLGSDPVPRPVAQDVREGEGSFLPAQEDAAVGLVGVPEMVFGVEDGDRLSARRQGLHKE
jgi:hypothetical protein